MKKKLKKQIEKQQLQQEEIEQGMLEEDGETSERNGDEALASSVALIEDCNEAKAMSTACEETVVSTSEVDTQDSELSAAQTSQFLEEIGSKTLQEKCVVSDEEKKADEPMGQFLNGNPWAQFNFLAAILTLSIPSS